MTQTTLRTVDASFAFPPVLAVSRVGAHEIVHVGATPIAQYPISDITTRRHVMVQLAEAGRVPGLVVAAQFGVTPVYVSTLRGRYRARGAGALTAQRSGPHGPMKVTARVIARVQTLRAEGRSYRAIVTALAATTPIAYQTVRRILTEAEPTQATLPTEGAETPSPGVETSDGAPASVRPFARDEATPAADAPPIATAPGVTPTVYAGAMLLHVALAQIGVWQVLTDVGARVGRTALSVAQVVGTVAFGFALRLRSVEGFKTAYARDFGGLLGLRATPCVQTLRTQVRAIAESVAPDVVMRALLAAVVQLEPVWEGAYSVDGHFTPYAGQHPVAKGWNAKRRLAEPGHTDIHVHDATGRALFFLNRPLNDALARALPAILAEIQAVAGHQPILLVFDRGGYSGPVFRALTAQGIGFLTYLKGRKARRRFPLTCFERRWWAVDDPAGITGRHRHVYRLYDRATRDTHAGLVRTLVVADGDAQIPVLTNRADLPAAKAVHLLRMRWRQENSFKYLSTHYGIEQIIQYGATLAPDTRLVRNPARAALRRQIAQLRATVVFQKADIGYAVSAGASVRATVTATVREASRAIDARLDRLTHRLTQTPTKVPVKGLPTGPQHRATLRHDRHDFVTALKLATYNAERLLARRFFRHYQDPRDWLTIFRAVLQAPGTLSQQPDGLITVALRPPDQPRIRRALVAFLDDINALTPRMFGAGPALYFHLNDPSDFNSTPPVRGGR